MRNEKTDARIHEWEFRIKRYLYNYSFPYANYEKKIRCCINVDDRSSWLLSLVNDNLVLT